MKRRSFLRLAALFLAGCASPLRLTHTPSPSPGGPPPVEPTACRLEPVIAPTLPAVLPDFSQVDGDGLHVAGNGPVVIDPAAYRLKVGGLVNQPLELSLDELRCLPKITAHIELTCPGVFRDEITYSGVPLATVLGLAHLHPEARAVHLVGADKSLGNLDLSIALDEDNFLAYQLKDRPLPVLHGFPLRAVIPARLGYAWTKYLVEIQVV